MNSIWFKLIDQCKRNNIHVKLVPTSALKDYAGMNDEIGRKMGFKFNGRTLPNRTIIIDRNLSMDTRIKTLKHELVEMSLMEKKHMSYWNAHKIALKKENKKISNSWF
jgi:hypothetical protein